MANVRSWRTDEWLVAWYGGYQAVHAVLNASYVLGDGPPPFPGPVGGWHPQAVRFLDAIAMLDLVNAVAAVAFAGAWLRAGRARRLGVVALTVSCYAAGVFSIAALTSGAWRASTSAPYLATWVPFVPVLALTCRWAWRGAPRLSAASGHAQCGEGES